jgi:hypothetical protein
MEQAPKPISETNFPKKSKTFLLNSDKNNKVNVNIQTESNLEISIDATFSNHQTKYSQVYSLKTLKNNKYLSSLDTIDEIFDEIINKIEYKNPILIEENKSLKFIIETGHSKFKEIIFYLNEKEKNINDKIDELYLYINQFIEREKIQDEKIKSLENKIKELENVNNELKKEIKSLNKTNEVESIILNNNKNYINTLKNWINPQKNFELKLLFRMSRDGSYLSTFHALCDNKGPTISLFYLDDGTIIGGYTPLDWNTFSGWKIDNDTFIFNLNKNLKFMKKSINCGSIFCHPQYAGFYNSFGYYEASNYDMKKLFFLNGDSYFLNGKQILNFNKETELTPKEVEVLSVITL